MRITKKIFNDLAIFMIGFGIFIGVIFPFFMILLGVNKEIAFSLKFFISCIIAGAIVGMVNIILSKTVVASRLRLLIQKMNAVQNKLMDAIKSGSINNCDSDDCFIHIDSEDELGKSAASFNYLVETLTASIKIQQTMISYTEMLASTLDLELLSKKALSTILNSTNSIAGAIFIEKEGKIIPLEIQNIKNQENLINHPMVLEVLRTESRKTIVIPDDLLIDSLLITFRPKELIIEPLIYNNIPIGALVLASLNSYTEDNKNKIKMFSQSFSLALHNAITHEQIQKLATIDALTGLLNRRYGLLRLKEEYSRAVRSESQLGVIMFDIDHFKKINDTYGHICGDRVLVEVSRIAKSLIREGDIMLRYGGEEFCIVLPGASIDDSYKLAERIRFAVQEHEVKYANYIIKVTISLGIASYPETHVKNEQELLKVADEMLYISKESGRNRSTFK